MNEKIVETLKLMCDKTNSQDKKIILLAELVEDRCTALGDNQAALQKSLNNTNAKLLQRRQEETDALNLVQSGVPSKIYIRFFQNLNAQSTLSDLRCK